MIRAMRFGPSVVLALLLALLMAAPTFAVNPDEVLDDPVLEERARDLSKGLRCLVCQNESIDESHASLARDLRILVRERLVAGDSDEEALAFIVDRYGEFVLLKPTTGGANWLLWAAGPGLFIIAMGLGFFYIRGRSSQLGPADRLTEDEKKRLEQILKG